MKRGMPVVASGDRADMGHDRVVPLPRTLEKARGVTLRGSGQTVLRPYAEEVFHGWWNVPILLGLEGDKWLE